MKFQMVGTKEEYIKENNNKINKNKKEKNNG